MDQGTNAAGGTTGTALPADIALGYRLVKLGAMFTAKADEALQPLGLRAKHFNLMAIVATDQSLSQLELSRRLGIDPNVTVGLIDDLERLRLAERRRNASDRRRHVIALTTEGGRVLAEGVARLAEVEAGILGCLTPEERTALDTASIRLLDSSGDCSG